MAEKIHESFDYLTNAMAEVLEGLFHRGFELPFYFAVISINGSIITGKYEAAPDGKDLSCEILTEHFPCNGFLVPINFMFVDRTGEAARVIIKKPGEIEFIN